jgi:hypothetical protein
MNERIRELREQAADFASQTYSKYTMATFDTNKSIETLFEEKFAELIVRECCDIFVELRTRPADLVVLDVKKHFGVEE